MLVPEVPKTYQSSNGRSWPNFWFGPIPLHRKMFDREGNEIAEAPDTWTETPWATAPRGAVYIYQPPLKEEDDTPIITNDRVRVFVRVTKSRTPVLTDWMEVQMIAVSATLDEDIEEE